MSGGSSTLTSLCWFLFFLHFFFQTSCSNHPFPPSNVQLLTQGCQLPRYKLLWLILVSVCVLYSFENCSNAEFTCFKWLRSSQTSWLLLPGPILDQWVWNGPSLLQHLPYISVLNVENEYFQLTELLMGCDRAIYPNSYNEAWTSFADIFYLWSLLCPRPDDRWAGGTEEKHFPRFQFTPGRRACSTCRDEWIISHQSPGTVSDDVGQNDQRGIVEPPRLTMG